MISHSKNKTTLTLLASLSVFGSLVLTSALAAPPKAGKKPPTKPADKPKADDPAAIAAGKKVYETNGCANCHAIGGTGGMAGPELTKVAANPKHTPKWMEEAVVNPKIHNPNSAMPAYESIKGKDLSNIVAYMGSLKK